MKKTACKRVIIVAGKKVSKDKRKYPTLDEAIEAARSINAQGINIHKAVAYKCNHCHFYHVGRNSTELTPKMIQHAKDFIA